MAKPILYKDVTLEKYKFAELELLHSLVVANEPILYAQSEDWRGCDWKALNVSPTVGLKEFVKHLKETYDIKTLRFKLDTK